MQNRTETCSACLRNVEIALIASPTEVDECMKPMVAMNARGWKPGGAMCIACLERWKRLHYELRSSYPELEASWSKILPTPLRLDASPRYTGRGVTIAFLDSGFYAHPDLTKPANRILKYINLVGSTSPGSLNRPDESSWHGMMTSVVAAGNGFLSRGLYSSIAPDASVVLVKVGTAARIRHEDIERGLRWVLRNRQRYNIRIVNISCGGDREASYLSDPLSAAAEAASRAEIVIVAAIGNAGGNPNHPVLPPASAPSVISVGGLDDKNTLGIEDDEIYHSSYGPTIDGLQKPEIIAPAIWLAAPILPGTPTAEQAALLAELEREKDSELAGIIRRHPGVDSQLDQAQVLDSYHLRNLVQLKIRDSNVISGNYKHVDGTSFAAPIVSSIAAQMIEATPALKPNEVKLALVKSAIPLHGFDRDRQGWGIVNARGAVEAALALGDKENTAP